MKRLLQILTVITLPIMATGQSPGGVGTPVVWLKAEQGVTTSGSTVNGWANTGSSGGSAGQLGRTSTTTWALPEFSANVHNFNPAIIDNSSTNDGSLLLADIFPSSAHRALSSFVLYSNSNVAQENNMIAFTPLKLTTGALEAPYLGSTGNNNLWFFWEGIYQTNPALPNTIVRQNNIPSVNAYYVPQWINSSTPHKTSMSMNGATTVYPGTGLVNAASRPFGNQLFIFGDGNSNNGNAGGKVSEIITYDRDLTTTEKQQINSYLSVKYGISLTTDNGTGVPNYLNSSAGTVWNSTTNSGYNNNIAGIANDSGSGLNQKQSKSVNTGLEQVIIGTTGLANTNLSNSTSLTNGQYLIWGDNGLARTFSQSITGLSQITARFPAVWRVQNSGNVGQVRIAWPKNNGIHLLVSNDPTFATGTTATAMSNVQMINGVEYNYADVTIGDGQYFTFGKYLFAPGGVVAAAWFRADATSAVYSDAGNTVAINNSLVQQWNEFNGMGTNISQATASARPVYSNTTKLTNFNPTITFDGSNDILLYQPSTNGNINIIDRSKGTLFSAGNIRGVATMLGFGPATDDPGLYSYSATNNLLLYPRTNEYDAISSGSTTGHYIGGGAWENGAGVAGNNSVLLSLRGNHQVFNTNIQNVLLDATRNDFRVGGDTDYARLNGEQNEVIVFPNKLTEDEVIKVESYLAIKYGQTLSSVQSRNYLSATGTVIWDGTINSAYYNNIVGIGREDISALHQKQSKSVNTGQKLVIGNGSSLFNTNALNTNNLTDGQFLIVGDNGLKQGLAVTITGISGVNLRFASIWKAQNTGSVGTVRIAWPSGLTNLKLIQSNDPTFASGNTDTDMSGNTQIINGVTYNYADVTLDNGQYFTFAAFGYAPGGVFNGLSQWYRADINTVNTGNGTDVISWTDYFSGTVSEKIGTAPLPKYVTGSASYFNFNPGINFTATNQIIGNISLPTLSSVNYDIFTLTKEGIAGNRFFNIGWNNTSFDGSNWDQPGFYANGDIASRTNTGGSTVYNTNPGSIAFSTTIPSIMYHTFTDTTISKGLNGALNGASFTHAAIGLVNGGHIFGANNGSTPPGGDDGGFTGNIGETIIYGAGNISAAERRKVDTYLAIKYGITLGRIATDNYISSADALIWNGALNTTYNNNIFGLAKDDVSSLHQKVSKSVNAGTILTIATNNDFVSQNMAVSRASLSGNQKYFLAGDNTVTATPLVSFTLGGVTAQRIQRIWLTQRTNTLGNVYFAVDLSAYGATFTAGNNIRMFVADDAAFTVNVQSVAGVLTGGRWVFNKSFDSDNVNRYITFGSEPQPQVLWLKADKGVNTFTGVPAADNTQLTTWFDQLTVDGGQNGIQAAIHPSTPAETDLPTMPFYRYNTTDNFNFNPVVNFDGTNNGQAVQMITPTKASQTIFSVFRSQGIPSQNSFYESGLLYGGDALNSNPTDGDTVVRSDLSFAVRSQSRLVVGGGSNGDFTFLGSVFLNNLPAIGTLKRDRVSDENVSMSMYSNGTTELAPENVDPTNSITGEGKDLINAMRIGKTFTAYENGVASPIGKLTGAIAETLVYDRVLTDAERARVETYLAVKYGITLTGGTKQSGVIAGNVSYPYVNSEGTVVRASDATYRFDVFGLGRDDFYGLNQRISKSNNPGDILTVSTNTDFTSLNLDGARTEIDGDREFMLFANNRGSANTVTQQTTELPTNVLRRIDREWKAAQSNTDGTNIPLVSLNFNLTGITLTGATSNNLALLIDSDGDGNFTTGTVQRIAASAYTAGSAAIFNNVAITDGQVFTLGIIQDVCYKPGAVATVGNPALETKIGITSLGRAGTDNENWPMVRTGGWLALESKTKGFVINRVAFADTDSNPATPDVPTGIPASDFVEGMMAYDTNSQCLKVYTSTDNGSTFAWRCITTQTCPD